MTEKIILGSAQFGLVYGRTNTTGLLPLEKVAEITKFAADNGVKYIDTARAYGVAEERFGKIFQDDPSLNESINHLLDTKAPQESLKVLREKLRLAKQFFKNQRF